MRTSIILSVAALGLATLPANACSWSKTSVTAHTEMPAMSVPAPVKVAVLRDAWLERMIG